MSEQHRFYHHQSPTFSRSVCGQCRQSIGRLAVLIALIVLGDTACTSADNNEAAAMDVQIDPVIAELFETTARSSGATYRVGYRALIQLGPDMRGSLQVTANATDWQDKWLARALILEIDHPERAELIRRVLRAIGRCEVRILDSGEIEIIYDEKYLDHRVESAKKTLIVGRETIPLFVQALPQLDEHLYTREPHKPTSALLDALVHFNNPETAKPMLWRCKHLAIDALVAMGDPVADALEDVIALPEGWRETPAPATRVAAATALGRIGADSSASALLAEMRTLATTDIPEKDHVGLAVAQAYCLAVADLQAADAAPVMFDLLLRTADGWGELGDSRTSGAYTMIRAAMLSLGPAARTELTARLDSEPTAAHRAIAHDMLIALDNPVDPSADAPEQEAFHQWRRRAALAGMAGNWSGPTIRERAASGVSLKYLPLVTLVDRPFGLDVLEQILLAHGETERDACRDYHRPIIRALGDMDDARVLDVLRKHLERRPTLCLGHVIDTLVRLSDADGVAILDDIIAALEAPATPQYRTHKSHLDRARVARKVLTASLTDLVDMATSSSSDHRREATYVLARRGHVEATVILLDKIVTDTDGGGRVWHNELLRLGDVALPTLRRRFEGGDNPDEKLLCEAVILRLTNPQLAADFDQVMRPPITQEFRRAMRSHIGPTMADHRNVGQHIADMIDPTALPLLEALAMMTPESPVLACALAAIGEDRSLTLMLRHIDRAPAWPILGFGPAGRDALIQAAQSPQPDQLATAHWSITSALATTHEPDPAGLEMILEALALVKTDHQVAGRARHYLRLAKRYHDPRLADGAFDVAQIYPDNREALQMLHEYDDPRLEEVCEAYIQQGRSIGSDVIKILIERKGDEVGSFLMAQLASCDDPRRRDWMIDDLRCAHRQIGPESRRLVGNGLLTYLADPSKRVQQTAAKALVWITPRPKKTTESLLEWAKTYDYALPDKVVRYLGKSRHPQAGPVLLALYRQRTNTRGSLPRALANLNYEPALPVIVDVMDQHIAEWRSQKTSRLLSSIHQEMLAIRRLGPDGQAKLMAILRDGADLPIRVEAALATAKGSRTDPDPEQLKLTQDLLHRLAINGLDDPSLTGTVHERTSAYRAMVHALMTALQGCPVDRAYPILLAATLKAKDPIIREKLAKRVVQLARQDPDLPALPPAYP
ncbi:hypothetical protein LCGC14_0161960 [marine sediment metagenome]|uniref:HEAT repeat domain-containing protein n=1 Tax=marine sediment metagenome TaxID=412755 RepID=A0A0F9XD53_9ZZZZ|nr:hypothetical protein [Phycisphaerae bacterium]HDZ43707.1 hypothetical protein [Phycisphaerae bacterium]